MFRGSTLLRSLAIVVVAGVVLIIVSDSLSSYRNLQLAYGGYYFCVLAGLTVLAGSSGQISLGQGAFMAVGAYTFCKLNASPVAWSVFPSLVGAVVAAVLDRDSGRCRGQPAARALPGRRDARVRGRAAGAGRQVPRVSRR